MSFKENINRICLERGTNLTAVVKEVKGSSSFTSANPNTLFFVKHCFGFVMNIEEVG